MRVCLCNLKKNFFKHFNQGVVVLVYSFEECRCLKKKIVIMQHTKYHLIKGFDTIYASLYLIFGGFFGSKYLSQLFWLFQFFSEGGWGSYIFIC